MFAGKTGKSLFTAIYQNNQALYEENDTEFMACELYTPLPLLVHTGSDYLLLTEAMVNGNYCGSSLFVNEETKAYGYRLVGNVAATLPLYTPWRVLMVGSLESIAESVILENLNDKTTLTNLSWVKPGRAVWNFGGEDFHSDYLSMSSIRKYIDWAKQQGWEYFTLDNAGSKTVFR